MAYVPHMFVPYNFCATSTFIFGCMPILVNLSIQCFADIYHLVGEDSLTLRISTHAVADFEVYVFISPFRHY